MSPIVSASPVCNLKIDLRGKASVRRGLKSVSAFSYRLVDCLSIAPHVHRTSFLSTRQWRLMFYGSCTDLGEHQAWYLPDKRIVLLDLRQLMLKMMLRVQKDTASRYKVSRSSACGACFGGASIEHPLQFQQRTQLELVRRKVQYVENRQTSEHTSHWLLSFPWHSSEA